MPKAKPIRCAIYTRVSHNGRDQDPRNQLIPLREYARGRGWKIAAEFEDRASAADDKYRTGWAQLRRAAERHAFDVVLVWKLDRAFRSTLMAEVQLRQLRSLGIDFVCSTQPIDTTNSMGRFVLRILGAAAEMERELISERTRAGLERAAAEGRKPGRPPGAKDGRKRHRRTAAELRAEREDRGRSFAVMELPA